MLRKQTKISLYIIALSGALLILLFLLYAHQVPKTLSEQDKNSIAKILNDRDFNLSALQNRSGFEDDIKTVQAIQDAILAAAPANGKIPLGWPREPYHLFESGHGQCSDRARALDKALRLAGFKTRYASIYSLNERPYPLAALVHPDTRSHAAVEVKTAKGWMAVGPNSRWIALTENFEPLSLEQLQNAQEMPRWHENVKGEIYPLLQDPFIYVYGLYSRHGQFYPPYNVIPDINWLEMLQNVYIF